jgi:hypothetical protein
MNIQSNWLEPGKVSYKLLLSRKNNLMTSFISVAGYVEYCIDYFIVCPYANIMQGFQHYVCSYAEMLLSNYSLAIPV